MRRMILVAGLVLALGCGGPEEPQEAGSDTGPGDLVVRVLTAGHNLDPDGYTLTLDGSRSEPVAINDTVTFVGLSATEHTLELTGLATTCHHTGPQPVAAQVRSGQVAAAALPVECLGIGDDVAMAFVRVRLDPDSSNIFGWRTGAAVVKLTHSAAIDQAPAWSPDGMRFAFSRAGELQVVNADGTGFIGLTVGSSPSWSPDGTRLAFHRGGSFGCGRTLHVIAATGGLVTDLGVGVEPNWSPDGTRIAFEACSAPESAIFVMEANGHNVRKLTTGDHLDREPAWSPDGGTIVFRRAIRSESSGYDIWIMNADGTGQIRVQALPDAEITPCWTRDGRILFAWRGGIYVVNRDGAGLTQLTGGGDVAPAWR